MAASAGNHAQGVAYSARHLGIRAVIVMPETTPEIKIDAVRELGAEVVLAGDSYAESPARAETLAAERGSPSCIPSTIRWSSRGRARSGRRSCVRARAASAVFVPVGEGG